MPSSWLSPRPRRSSRSRTSRVHFPVGGYFRGRRSLPAVDGVDLELKKGECLGVVGESGCGKSTLALSILGLQAPTRGRILLDGHEVGAGMDRMARARIAQLVFQDPYSSLNPRQTVRATLATPLRLHGMTDDGEIDARIAAMLAQVGLRPEHAARYPHEFSGGQRQRIGIARALILRPKVVLLDEPVSALDVSIRAQIINLLLDLKDAFGLSYIMISHDLGVVEHMSDRVAVMYLGRVVETGRWETIFTRPAPSLHARPHRRDSRPLRTDAGRQGHRRGPQSARSADRVQLPPALPRGEGHLPGAAGAPARGRRRGPSRPLPAGGRACRLTGSSAALNPLLSFRVVPYGPDAMRWSLRSPIGAKRPSRWPGRFPRVIRKGHGRRRRKPMVQKAQALARRRDSSLKHADEPCPGAFKPIAIPAVAAAVTVGAKLERRKRAERDTPAILRDDEFFD